MIEKKAKGRGSSSRTILRSPFCMPRIKGSSCARKTNFSLFDRFRDAVLRLIMLSALSKAATTQESKSNAHRSSTYYEPHHSEALADCIEFIKKSATADVEICAAAEDDGSGRMCSDAAAEVVLPVPVIM